MTIKSSKFSEILRPNIGHINPGPLYVHWSTRIMFQVKNDIHQDMSNSVPVNRYILSVDFASS